MYGVAIAELESINPGWSKKAIRGSSSLPRDAIVWLPRGTLDRSARQGGPTSAPALPEAQVHVVHRGDTLSDIAAQYGISVATLRELNGISPRSSLIGVGQELQLPVGTTDAQQHVDRLAISPKNNTAVV